MIVKVQISQFDSEGRTRMLVYDKTRKHMMEREADTCILKKMGDDPKKFFHAEVKNGKFEIGQQAPWENW